VEGTNVRPHEMHHCTVALQHPREKGMMMAMVNASDLSRAAGFGRSRSSLETRTVPKRQDRARNNQNEWKLRRPYNLTGQARLTSIHPERDFKMSPSAQTPDAMTLLESPSSVELYVHQTR
jgi:hypothetical protein